MPKIKYMKVLLVDDEKRFIRSLLERMEYEGFDVLHVKSCRDALKVLKTEYKNIAVAIIDNCLPIGKQPTFLEEGLSSGFEVGLELAKYISRTTDIKIIGFSGLNNHEIVNEFKRRKFHYIWRTKIGSTDELCDTIKNILRNKDLNPLPNVFIVHGHDRPFVIELKNYLQNSLKFGEPAVLDELPSKGKTIVEKFEEYSAGIDLAFVLLTPDDLVKDNTSSYFQPRPNVLYELGFFHGKLSRISGRVIILSKSKIKLPSDISGIGYIDISGTIAEAGEKIRKELKEWL